MRIGFQIASNNAPDRIRTCDLRLRRPTLYPTELRAHKGGRGKRISRVLCHSVLQLQCVRRGSFLWDRGYPWPRAAYPGLPTSRSAARATPRPLFGLAPGGVCRAAPVTGSAVVSYTTVSPLPVPSRAIGGLLSVALSVASRRPAVSRHPALRSSDFPRPPRTGVRAAAIRTRFPDLSNSSHSGGTATASPGAGPDNKPRRRPKGAGGVR